MVIQRNRANSLSFVRSDTNFGIIAARCCGVIIIGREAGTSSGSGNVPSESQVSLLLTSISVANKVSAQKSNSFSTRKVNGITRSCADWVELEYCEGKQCRRVFINCAGFSILA